jgi:hypothetical protein
MATAVVENGNERMTPFEIEILLYYHYSAVDDNPNKNAPMFKETMDRFVNLGLIRATPSQHPCCYFYSGNREALAAYVNAICAVPLPVQKWVVEFNFNLHEEF